MRLMTNESEFLCICLSKILIMKCTLYPLSFELRGLFRGEALSALRLYDIG
jgi:hypothetical protein